MIKKFTSNKGWATLTRAGMAFVAAGFLSTAGAAVSPTSEYAAGANASLAQQIGINASSEENYSLGAQAFRRGDHAGAVRFWEMAGDQGHWRAQHNLGYAYATGTGVTVNYEQAAYWWQRAAYQGIAEAQYNLGALYYDGRGVAQDAEAALLWWYRAANGGDAAAQFRLGLVAVSGEEGGAVNFSEAEWWWHQSAAKGFKPAIQGLEMLKAQEQLVRRSTN
jgi:TPR repeat protein